MRPEARWETWKAIVRTVCRSVRDGEGLVGWWARKNWWAVMRLKERSLDDVNLTLEGHSNR